jgi:hypothetical protein
MLTLARKGVKASQPQAILRLAKQLRRGKPAAGSDRQRKQTCPDARGD